MVCKSKKSGKKLRKRVRSKPKTAVQSYVSDIASNIQESDLIPVETRDELYQEIPMSNRLKYAISGGLIQLPDFMFEAKKVQLNQQKDRFLSGKNFSYSVRKKIMGMTRGEFEAIVEEYNKYGGIQSLGRRQKYNRIPKTAPQMYNQSQEQQYGYVNRAPPVREELVEKFESEKFENVPAVGLRNRIDNLNQPNNAVQSQENMQRQPTTLGQHIVDGTESEVGFKTYSNKFMKTKPDMPKTSLMMRKQKYKKKIKSTKKTQKKRRK